MAHSKKLCRVEMEECIGWRMNGFEDKHIWSALADKHDDRRREFFLLSMHYGRRKSSSFSQAREWAKWAVQANEQKVERVAQYSHLGFWLIWPPVQWLLTLERQASSSSSSEWQTGSSSSLGAVWMWQWVSLWCSAVANCFNADKIKEIRRKMKTGQPSHTANFHPPPQKMIWLRLPSKFVMLNDN